MTEYKYIVELKVDVKRTDNEHLTDSEDTMVEEMHSAARMAIAGVMAKYGQGKSKEVAHKKVKY